MQQPPSRGALLRGVVILAALLAAAITLRPLLLKKLLAGDSLLFLALVAALAGYSGEHILRGTLAGYGLFRRYATVLASEGLLRLAGCIALAALGVTVAGPYGLVIG